MELKENREKGVCMSVGMGTSESAKVSVVATELSELQAVLEAKEKKALWDRGF